MLRFLLIQGGGGFQALYDHAISVTLASILDVYPLRIGSLMRDQSPSKPLTVIAFALYDFAGAYPS